MTFNAFAFAEENLRLVHETPAPPPEKEGPHQCCSAYAFVVESANGFDRWECKLCSMRWIAPCR